MFQLEAKVLAIIIGDSINNFCIPLVEFFRGSVLSHQAIAGSPLLLASIGREQILDMLNKVYVWAHIFWASNDYFVCMLFFKFPDDVETVKRMLHRR